MTNSTVLGLSFDTRDAGRVARFWADALGSRLGRRRYRRGRRCSRRRLQAGPRLAFDQASEDKTVKNRVPSRPDHDRLRTESERLVSLGATVVRTISGQATWTTFADPEGNEFDLVNG